MEYISLLTFSDYNPEGIITGFFTLASIWITRMACIKGEYHLGQLVKWIFLLVGIAGVVLSLLTENIVTSAIFAIFGFCCLWGIHEVAEQKERVKKGWYPVKPGKK